MNTNRRLRYFLSGAATALLLTSLLTGALKVRLSSGDSTTENYYNKSEVRVLRGKRPRNEEPAEE